MNSASKNSASKANKLEKLKNALHPITSKKIEVVYTAADNCLFYISPSVDSVTPKKNNNFNGEYEEVVQNKEYIITADEFQEIYLKSVANEIQDLSNNVNAQVNHMNNHRDNQLIDLESDMLFVENKLIDTVKLLCKKYKEA